MKKEYLMVKDFHRKFGHPNSDNVIKLEQERVIKRYRWMQEEIDEFIQSKDIYEQADAMIDLIYFALGTLVEMGIEPTDCFNIVHKANMSKLWEDGLPHYNEDGKTIKPIGWIDPEPELKRVIDKMSIKKTIEKK